MAPTTSSPKGLSDRLDRIRSSLTAKGHPMQDFSTLRLALLDLIDIVRALTDGPHPSIDPKHHPDQDNG